MERLDALAVREDKNGKAWFTKIGAAFPNKDGKGYTLMLDAVPASTDGQYKIMLREPMPKDDRGQSQNRRQASGGRDRNDSWGSVGGGGYDDLDDDIPF